MARPAWGWTLGAVLGGAMNEAMRRLENALATFVLSFDEIGGTLPVSRLAPGTFAAGDYEIGGTLHLTGGGQRLGLHDTLATQHAYLAFFTEALVRKGWIGYGGVGTTTLTIDNERVGGNVRLSPGAGGVVVLDGDAAVSGYLLATGIAQAGNFIPGYEQRDRATTGFEAFDADAAGVVVAEATAPGITYTIAPVSAINGTTLVVACANTSGGAATFAFDTSFRLAAAAPAPATGFVTLVTFVRLSLGGLQWFEASRATVAI